MIGLDTNVIVRYLAQDDARQAAIATRLIEGSLSAEARGFVSIITLSEVVWVMASNYRAAWTAMADIVEGLLTAPQLAIEKADVIWRALIRDSRHFASGGRPPKGGVGDTTSADIRQTKWSPGHRDQ